MSGIETARRIDEDPRLNRRIPKIILVTAYGRDEVSWQAEEAGLAGFLLKPVRRSTVQVKTGLGAGDVQRARRILHNFEGVAGNIAAEAVRGGARELSRAIRGKKTEGIPGLLERLPQALSEVVQSVRELESEKTSVPFPASRESDAAPPVDRSRRALLMKALSGFLQENNMEAISCLDSVQGCLGRTQFREELATPEYHINKLDFGGAQSALQAVARGFNISLEESRHGYPRPETDDSHS